MVHTLNDVFARSEVKPSVFPAIMSLFAFRKINVKIFLRKLTGLSCSKHG